MVGECRILGEDEAPRRHISVQGNAKAAIDSWGFGFVLCFLS